MQKGGCRASRRARVWVRGVAWVKSRGRGCWAPQPTCLGSRGSSRPDKGRTPASLSLQGLPAPSPSADSRCLDVARGGDCYFKKSPWRVWMLSPTVPTQLGRLGGHAQGGHQVASGALGLCLGWDSDGTGDSTMGVLLPGRGVLGPSLLPRGPRDPRSVHPREVVVPITGWCQLQGYPVSPVGADVLHPSSPPQRHWGIRRASLLAAQGHLTLPLGTWKVRPGGQSLSFAFSEMERRHLFALMGCL